MGISLLSEGAQLIINTYPQEIQESIEMHPTCVGVPRFWEKVYIAVKQRMMQVLPEETLLPCLGCGRSVT